LRKGSKPPKGVPRRNKKGQISKTGRYYGGDGGDSSASESIRYGGGRTRKPGPLRKIPKGTKSVLPRRGKDGKFRKRGKFRGGDGEESMNRAGGKYKRKGSRSRRRRRHGGSVSRSLSASGSESASVSRSRSVSNETRSGGKSKRKGRKRRSRRRGGDESVSQSRTPSVSVSRSQSVEMRAGGARKRKYSGKKRTSRNNYLKAAKKLGLMHRVSGSKLRAAPRKGTDGYRRIKSYMRTGK
jgi:hypothetical protein